MSQQRMTHKGETKEQTLCGASIFVPKNGSEHWRVERVGAIRTFPVWSFANLHLHLDFPSCSLYGELASETLPFGHTNDQRLNSLVCADIHFRYEVLTTLGVSRGHAFGAVVNTSDLKKYLSGEHFFPNGLVKNLL